MNWLPKATLEKNLESRSFNLRMVPLKKVRALGTRLAVAPVDGSPKNNRVFLFISLESAKKIEILSLPQEPIKKYHMWFAKKCNHLRFHVIGFSSLERLVPL